MDGTDEEMLIEDHPDEKQKRPRLMFGPDNDLTDREASFCKAYVCVTQLDGDMAFDIAGYRAANDALRHRYVLRLLKRPSIKHYIDELSVERSKTPAIDRIWVMEKLKRIVLENDGKPAHQLKALELLGNSIGMFKNINEIIDKTEDPSELAKAMFKDREGAFRLIDFKKKVMDEVNKEGGNNGTDNAASVGQSDGNGCNGSVG